MRTRAAIFLLLAALAACGMRAAGDRPAAGEVPRATAPTGQRDQGGDQEANMMNESVIKQVSMRATAENTKAALVIKYEVQNHTDQAAYLWDLMIKYEGSEQKIDHDGAYVFFEEPKTLNVIRAELPLPKTFDIARKEIPNARLLPPGGKLEGTVTLKHPIKEVSPYYPSLKEEEQAVANASVVNLMVAWTMPKPGMTITQRTVGAEKVFAIRGSWAPPHQEIMQETFPIETPVLIYTTPFERMKPQR